MQSCSTHIENSMILYTNIFQFPLKAADEFTSPWGPGIVNCNKLFTERDLLIAFMSH